jgi:hypothetical protein
MPRKSDTLPSSGYVGSGKDAIIGVPSDADQALSPVTFKIQILASSAKVSASDSRFRDYKNIKEYKVGNMYKYAIEGGSSYDEANSHCRRLQSDFPGAFVIAVRDSNIIPVEQALKEFNGTQKNK